MEKCIFCDKQEMGPRSVPGAQTEHFFAVFDANPVNTWHTLIIPRRHILTSLDFTEEEMADFWNIRQKVVDYFWGDPMAKQLRGNPRGFNIGENIGGDAGQTVFHAHVHVIPRYRGDVENPRGGIRNIKRPLQEW